MVCRQVGENPAWEYAGQVVAHGCQLKLFSICPRYPVSPSKYCFHICAAVWKSARKWCADFNRQRESACVDRSAVLSPNDLWLK